MYTSLHDVDLVFCRALLWNCQKCYSLDLYTCISFDLTQYIIHYVIFSVVWLAVSVLTWRYDDDLVLFKHDVQHFNRHNKIERMHYAKQQEAPHVNGVDSKQNGGIAAVKQPSVRYIGKPLPWRTSNDEHAVFSNISFNNTRIWVKQVEPSRKSKDKICRAMGEWNEDEQGTKHWQSVKMVANDEKAHHQCWRVE